MLITDFGHDPDDAIALSYLIEHRVVPEVIIVTPGFDHQVKCLNGFLKLYNLNSQIAIFTAMVKSDDHNCGPHSLFYDSTNYKNVYSLLDKKNLSFKNGLCLGPPKNCKERVYCEEIVIQGGYSPNSIKPLEKFAGMTSCQSFNPNGAPKDFEWLLEQTVGNRYVVGKNVCHGYTLSDVGWRPQERLVSKFYGQLNPHKKMHDVLAAKIYMNKDIGFWEQAKPLRVNGQYTTIQTTEKIFSLIGLK